MMNKNKKKLLILAGVIIAIVVLIFADKSFKEKQQEKQGASETETTAPVDNVLDDEAVKDKESEDKADESESDSEEKSDKNGDSDSAKKDDSSELSDDEVSYEEWLAAGAVTAVSMQYMDFELEKIYLLSETSMSDKIDSKGVYVFFKSDGKDLVIHSNALVEERSYPGTVDFSTQNFGLATFDEVEVTESDLEKCTKIELDDLVDLISQLMLVTVYEH